MKKLLLFLAISAMATTSFAQDENLTVPQAKGLGGEINTGFGESSGSYTGFSLYSRDGNTSWGVGGEAGYFILDDLALKAGPGYGDPDWVLTVLSIEI